MTYDELWDKGKKAKCSDNDIAQPGILGFGNLTARVTYEGSAADLKQVLGPEPCSASASKRPPARLPSPGPCILRRR